MTDIRDELLAELSSEIRVPPDVEVLWQRSQRRRRKRARVFTAGISSAVIVAVIATTLTIIPSHGHGTIVLGIRPGLTPTQPITENVPIAQGFVDALIASVPLPPGAKPLYATPVPSVGSKLSPVFPPGVPSDPPESLGTDNSVSEVRVWSTALTQTQLLGYLQLHQPQGLRLQRDAGFLYGSGQAEFESFTALDPPSGVWQAILLVTAVPLSSGTALRIDGQAIWLPVRSAGETVPSGIALVNVKDNGVSPPRRVVLTDPAAIAVVVQGFNQLAAVPSLKCQGGAPVPGQVHHLYEIDFVVRIGLPPLTAETTYCDFLDVGISSVGLPELQPTPAFLQTLSAVLAGSKLFATLSMPTTSIASGSSVTGVVQVQNLTGHVVRPAICGPPFTIELVSPTATPTQLGSGLCLDNLKIPTGMSTYPVIVRADYISCSPPNSPPPNCVAGQPPPLPPGLYDATLLGAPNLTIDLPDSTPVEVTNR